MSVLQQAYNPNTLAKKGSQLIQLLTNHLKDSQLEAQKKTINWKNPEEQLAFWQQQSQSNQEATDIFKTILSNSINLHNPKYMGHQVAPTLPLAALAGLLSAYLNNGMAVYEMGATASALEKLIMQQICAQIGYDASSDGFITSGGTLANLTALLAARRQILKDDVWEQGSDKALAVMVSEEAHYCIDRAARIMGLGTKGIIKIPVDSEYRMQTELLEEKYIQATNQGLTVIAVIGSAPTTSTGIYDNLEAIADFCELHKLWFHVDGAHGGAVIYSKKYKNLVKGVNRADSVVIDGHKMMMMPSIMTFLAFKNKVHSYQTFNQKAQYLWESSEDEEWYNYAKRTFECTKSMMSIQFYIVQQTYGDTIFEEYVDTLYDLGKTFYQLVEEQDNLENFLRPDANIVCFRYTHKNLSQEQHNQINLKIRRAILEEGRFYIVQTLLNADNYLRVTLMNPFTSVKEIKELLEIIETLGNSFITQNT
ncbi:pyridoxal phosphate-dependent decarboxylase family protein [Aquimarina brevivitae]|uniref:L-2,4-diaminobutyrate decarboxylase n=1 Tax=Aquimarina brevivitae TaxID=323412 RepID=A0A4Q7PF20_9FLAO|nr:aminotransferase class I/II-fold pyridoxal phosphate-dependent enzyme [Aquimarina brevivitae]RZS99041.1 L-2,4-diaminobutyrate decarboxylase [Aquimarina brevivitae]